MKSHRPSITLLAGFMLLIVALVAAFFPKDHATDSSESSITKKRLNRSLEPKIEAQFSSDRAARPERMSRVDKLIRDRFPEERDAEFNESPGELSQVYKEKGLTDFCGQMRKALHRDEDAIAKIFTTYRAEPESYGIFVNMLIENLGDSYFLQQVQKQPESIQYDILGQIWQTIYRSPLDYQSDGSIPVADGVPGGLYYPKTGELFLKLLEKELQSDYWQRKMKLRSEQAAPEQPLPAAQSR
jgi:hypothetical protein